MSITDEIKQDLETSGVAAQAPPDVPTNEPTQPPVSTNSKEPITEDWFTGFKSEFSDFKDKDSLKEILAQKDKILKVSEYEAKQKQYDEKLAAYDDLSKKYEDAKKKINPRSHFANDTLYKMNEIIKKNPDKPASLMAVISTVDENTLSDIDAAVLNYRLSHPSTSEDVARKLMLRKSGIDPENMEDWSDIDKALVKELGSEARANISNIKNVEIPGDVDYDKLAEQEVAAEQERQRKATESWTPMVNKLTDSIGTFTHEFKNDKGEKEFDFEFVYDKPEMKADLNEYLVDIATELEMDINEDNLKKLKGIADSFLLERNKNMIFNEIKKDISTRLRDQFHNETNNPKPLSDVTNPVGTPLDAADENQRKLEAAGII